MRGPEGRADDQEFALKEAERRHPDDRQHGHQKTAPVSGITRITPPLTLVEQVGLEVLVDVAGAEEQQRLGHRVIRHVQHQRQRAELAADAERGHHDAGVIDGVIGQQAPEVLLHQNERHRDAHRQQSEQKQQAARKLRRPGSGW